MKTSSRRSAIASPTTRSAPPSAYISAVSMTVIPSSMPVRSAATSARLRSWSSPMRQVPSSERRAHERGTIRDAVAAEQLAEVLVDGGGADPQPAGYLLRRMARRDEFEDLALSGGRDRHLVHRAMMDAAPGTEILTPDHSRATKGRLPAVAVQPRFERAAVERMESLCLCARDERAVRDIDQVLRYE